MKKIFQVISVLFLALIFVLLFVTSSDRRALRAESWQCDSIQMPGRFSSCQEEFGISPLLTFKRTGRCILEMEEETKRGFWLTFNSKLYIIGFDLRLVGTISRDYYSKEVNSLYFQNFFNYGVYFSRLDHIQEMQERIEKGDREKAKKIKDFRTSFDYDLSSLPDDFLSFFISSDFGDFERLEISTDNKEQMLEKYFHDLESLGMAKEYWIYYLEDPNKVLDGYEDFVFNASLSQEERDKRDGEKVQLPFEVVASFIEKRIKIFREFYDSTNRASYYLDNIFEESWRYENGSYTMEIKKDLPSRMEAEILAVWKLDEKVIIHIGYGKDSEEGQGWVLLKEIPGEDQVFYEMGYYKEGED